MRATGAGRGPPSAEKRDEGQRREWFARRRYLWGLRAPGSDAVERRAGELAAPLQTLAEISEMVRPEGTAPSRAVGRAEENMATTGAVVTTIAAR